MSPHVSLRPLQQYDVFSNLHMPYEMPSEVGEEVVRRMHERAGILSCRGQDQIVPQSCTLFICCFYGDSARMHVNLLVFFVQWQFHTKWSRSTSKMSHKKGSISHAL
jgi:hypothetical protein